MFLNAWVVSKWLHLPQTMLIVLVYTVKLSKIAGNSGRYPFSSWCLDIDYVCEYLHIE